MLLESARTERPRGFRLIGEIDISNETALASILGPEVELGGDITLDLTELTFADSVGIRVLMEAARALDGRGLLYLAGARPALSRAFDLMGVHRATGIVVVGDPLRAGDVAAVRTARDLVGDVHPVEMAHCACGCPYLYATDDLALFWEPGDRFAEGCTDRSCECHVSPLRG